MESHQKKFKYFLIIDITSKCNLSCFGCSSASSINSSDNNYFLNVENLKNNLLFLKNKSPFLKGVILTGGEPTLHPNFIEILEILKSFFPEIPVNILTNGLFLNNFSNEKLIKLSSLNIEFSISLYPKNEFLDQVKKNIAQLKKYKIKFSLWDKGRLTFFGSFFNFTLNKEKAQSAFNECEIRKERFFILIDNKIFRCLKSIELFNLNFSFSSSDYVLINENYNENAIFTLRETCSDMCSYCYQTEGIGSNSMIWHLKTELNNVNNLATLKELFLYDYENYKILRDDHSRVLESLKNPFFEYYCRRHKNEGYNEFFLRYYNGIGDICIIFSNNMAYNQISLKQIYQLIQNQQEIKNLNIYILCINLDSMAENLIYSQFCPTPKFSNIYFIKSKTYQEGIDYFFKNSFSKKYFIFSALKFYNLYNKDFFISQLINKKKD